MKKIFYNLEELIAGFFLIITVTSVVLNVFCRAAGFGTISTSEEIATISFVWSVYIGAVACYKRKMHIGVDMLVQMFSDKGKKIFTIFLDIFFNSNKFSNIILMCNFYNELTRKTNTCFRYIIKLFKYSFADIIFLDGCAFIKFFYIKI